MASIPSDSWAAADRDALIQLLGKQGGLLSDYACGRIPVLSFLPDNGLLPNPSVTA